MASHNDLGKYGEQLAVDFLLNKGYALLATNYVYQKAEIDIIALFEGTLAVVEVKTRSSLDFGNPQDFLKPKQIQRIIKAVNEFVLSNDLDVEVRFDIIAIVKKGSKYDIEHLENAFYHF
ncbi:putative endonuclease [Formosa sp. Hel1_31_208]|uniref:YraN family protein n=1 Tax=Formosa sp. Hel1_31_208 TaxID=1798225 RepID=UPI000879EA8C|nr:YraN family protein [Formosa sp. Hel1_31_208]SDR79208.1 putative endonuclease [Formosa sp. Hel1_31_208]